MARSSWDGDTIVYRYRCPASAGRDVPELALTQLRLANDLRNKLVEIEHAHDEAKARLWLTDPAVAAAQSRLDTADADVDALITKSKEERRRDRTTVPQQATRDAIAAAKRYRRTTKDELQAARDAALGGLRIQFRDLESQRRTAAGDAGRAAKAEGLPWHTHDMVLDDHDRAVKAVNRKRTAGQLAQLRFQRFDGSGTLRVTLMRHQFRHGCGGKKTPWPCGNKMPRDCPDRVPHHPERTPNLLTSGAGPWRNIARLAPHMCPDICELSPPRRHGERETLRFRLTDGVWWDVPVFVHRPLPAAADVVSVQVTRRRVAAQHRLSVTVTARVPKPAAAAVAGAARVAVHVGWRSLGRAAGVRVATVTSTGRLPQPPDQPELAGVVRRINDRSVEIVAPADWFRLAEKTASLRSIRDQALDPIRSKVVDALTDGVEGMDVSAGDVSRWRSPARFAVLAKDWPQRHPLADVLEAWRRRDKHLWLWEAHGADQLAARRKDTWRKIGAWLAALDAGVVVDDTDIRALTRVPDAPEADDPQHERARSQRQTAAPGELRAAIAAAVTLRGSTVETAAAGGRVHHGCGREIREVAQFAAGVIVWCPHCEIAFDQDTNATLHMLSRTSGDPDPGQL